MDIISGARDDSEEREGPAFNRVIGFRTNKEAYVFQWLDGDRHRIINLFTKYARDRLKSFDHVDMLDLRFYVLEHYPE